MVARGAARVLPMSLILLLWLVFPSTSQGTVYLGSGPLQNGHLDLFGDGANNWDDLYVQARFLMTLDYPSSGWGWDMQLGRYQSTPMVLVAANQVYPLGQVMDGALAYQTSNSIAYHNYSTSTGVWVSGGPWVNQSGYAGLKVVHGGQTYYGWAEVSETWNPDSGPYGSAGIHVQRWGMETNPNVSIVAGQTADPLLAGDADMNGKVEFTDYLALETHFGRSGVNWTGGDFNNDGKVTFQDYLLLEQNFAKAVPEPATISLLVLASFGLLRRR